MQWEEAEGNQRELRQPPEVVAQSVWSRAKSRARGHVKIEALCVALCVSVCVCGHGLACQVRPDTA